MEPGVFVQPRLYVRVLMGRGVIEDHVNLEALGDLAVHLPQELEELSVTVPG
jgi:hypothetical protein